MREGKTETARAKRNMRKKSCVESAEQRNIILTASATDNLSEKAINQSKTTRIRVDSDLTKVVKPFT